MKLNKNKESRVPFLKVIWAMIVLSYRAKPMAYVLFLVSSLIFTALLVVDLHYVRILLDSLPLFVDGAVSYRAVLITIIFLGSVNVLFMIANGCANLLYEYLEKHTAALMTEKMSAKAVRLRLVEFESAELYDKIEKAVNGRERSFNAMEAVVFSIIFHGGYFLFLGLYLITVEPVLVLGIAGSFLPVALSRYIRASAFYKSENRIAPLRRRFSHYEDCMTDREFFKETRTSGIMPLLRNLYSSTLSDYSEEIWKTEIRTGKIDLLLKLLTMTGYAGLLFLLIHYLFRGDISAGMFGAVYFALDNIFKWFEELFGRLGGAYEDAAFAGNYLKYLNTEERSYGTDDVEYDAGIRLNHVSFAYPATDADAIHDVSLEIRGGETIAIVGANGAGKTTLVRLISGMYVPDSGAVIIGGTDVRSASYTSLYTKLSAVFQRFLRYRMTVEENVHLSEIDSARSVTTALELAEFPVKSNRFPEGTDTMLSREFGGTDLSGGEWQRLAIARGLYRSHDCIILDEPTASIDPIEETHMYEKFAEAAANNTAIIVTHRLGSARIADRIVVMDRSRIVEVGSHDQLLAANGMYARMFREQTRWYDRDESAT